MIDKKQKLSELLAPVSLMPQLIESIEVADKEAVLKNESVQSKYKEINEEIGDNGRILLRESGTEPVIRIMVEYPTLEGIEEYIEKLYVVLKKRGLICE